MHARRSVNLMRWKCSIPGREGTDWQGGFFQLTMEFSEDYPAKPPKVPARRRGRLSVIQVICTQVHPFDHPVA